MSIEPAVRAARAVRARRLRPAEPDAAKWLRIRVTLYAVALLCACGGALPSERGAVRRSPGAQSQAVSTHDRAKAKPPAKPATIAKATAGQKPSAKPSTRARKIAPPPAPELPTLLAAKVTPAALTADPHPELDLSRVDALIANAIAARQLPGCVIAIGRHDRVYAVKAYGKRARVPAEFAMTEDTVFDLASLTKPVATGTAIAQLVERGALALDGRVSRYLPELNRPRTRAITVRQLLLHTAGLPHVNPLTDYSGDPRANMARTLAVEPIDVPGQRFLYSDVGYIWLGELVRRVSEQPLESFAQSSLFGPLAMRDTRYAPPASWQPRIAPTEISELRAPTPQLIWGSVHDPRAYRLGGIAGNAGVFSTAADLARYARMLLSGGELDGTRVLSAKSVAALTKPQLAGGILRTPGFDARSEYSRLRGRRLSARAFGHGGYTGTSLWVDPERDLFVVFLSNRVHPDAKGNVIGLVGAVTDEVVAAVAQLDDCALLANEALPGIDALQARGFDRLRGKRIGLVTHLAATTRAGIPTIDVLARAPGVTLGAVFTPEHGLESARDGRIADGSLSLSGRARALPDPPAEPSGAHPTAGSLRSSSSVPTYSLFGQTRRPDARMLQGLDVLVVDLVDVGTRFYTYMSTLHEILRAGAEHGLPVIVLDRPNPLGGLLVDGPVLDADVRSFVNHHPLPVVHGLSAGELATLIVRDEGLSVQLEVIQARGWRREARFADTGLRWRRPSPNLPRAESALLYPAVGLLESTNLSVGRGTARPFEQFGAPWLDPRGVLADLAVLRVPGVRFSATTYTPSAAPYAGQPCQGIRLQVTNPDVYRPTRTALAIAQVLRARHAGNWKGEGLTRLLGDQRTYDALLAGTQSGALPRLWGAELHTFAQKREQVLLYRDCRR